MTLQEHYRAFRIHLAVKATIAAAVCGCIGIVFHLSYGYLSPLVTILVLVVFRGHVVKAGVPGYLAILVAGIAAILISMVLHEAAWAYVLCMLALQFFWMAFLTPAPLGHMVGGILIAMVLFTVALGTDQAAHLVASFWTQVFIALVVAGSIDRLLWPSNSAKPQDETLAALFEEFAKDLDALGNAVRTGEAVDHVSMAELSHIAHLSNFFGRGPGGEAGAEFELNVRCRLIWDRLHALTRHIQDELLASLPQERARFLADITSELARHFRDLSSAALGRQSAPGLPVQTIQKVDAFIAAIHEGRRQKPQETHQSLSEATLVRFLRQALSDHAMLAKAYNATLVRRTVGAQRNAAAGAPERRSLFPSPDARIYRTSAKLVLIIAVLLVGVLYLDFPGSSLVAFYGITFGLTTNLGQLYMKGKTGLIGILAALAYGALGVLIVVQTPHFLVLLGLFSLGVFVSAYISSGDETVAFMGLQAALVTPYVFLVFEGPEWTLDNAVTRACALAVSAAVAVVIQRLLWPVDPSRLFREATVTVLHDIARVWASLWARSGKEDSGAGMVERDSSDALIVGFGESTTLLNDSRHMIGSDHPQAHAYLQILRALEEIFGELRILARLTESARESTLLDDALDRLAQPIDVLSKGFGTVADHIRDGGDGGTLRELHSRLAAFQHLSTDLHDIVAQHPAAPLEDARRVSLTVETVSDVAKSLATAVEAARVAVPPTRKSSALDSAHESLAAS